MLITAFQEHKTTEAYVSVVENANKSASARRWERNQIWWAEYDHAQGQELASQVADGTVSLWDLNGKQQKLVEDFDCRRSGNTLHNLHQERSYRGAGHEVTTGIRGWWWSMAVMPSLLFEVHWCVATAWKLDDMYACFISDYIYFTPYKYLLKRVLTQRCVSRSPSLQGSVPLVSDPGFSKRKFPRKRFQG